MHLNGQDAAMSPTAPKPAHQPGGAQLVTYQLHIDVARPLSLTVGRLGYFFFPAGKYVYTGSARRHLEARIARHLRLEKTLRWHIDWLLAAPGVRVIAVRRSKLAECELNQRTGGKTLVPGFGASDCCRRCNSHLRYLTKASLSRAPNGASLDKSIASRSIARHSSTSALDPGAPSSGSQRIVSGSAGLRSSAINGWMRRMG